MCTPFWGDTRTSGKRSARIARRASTACLFESGESADNDGDAGRGARPAGAAGYSARSSLEQWLLRRLNDPTPRELTHERKGNVYIYDGLTDREVDRALNAYFDRIEYMMFLGTRRTDATGEELSNEAGEIETESPGCGGP